MCLSDSVAKSTINGFKSGFLNRSKYYSNTPNDKLDAIRTAYQKSLLINIGRLTPIFLYT